MMGLNMIRNRAAYRIPSVASIQLSMKLSRVKTMAMMCKLNSMRTKVFLSEGSSLGRKCSSLMRGGQLNSCQSIYLLSFSASGSGSLSVDVYIFNKYLITAYLFQNFDQSISILTNHSSFPFMFFKETFCFFISYLMRNNIFQDVL